MPENEVGSRPSPEEPPPVFGRWWALYALVIAGLVAMIGLCGALTRWGAR